MAACIATEETFGWKLFTYLEMFPHHYDVGFSVGPQKVMVKALSVILRASSKVFEREFKNRWENAVVPDGDGEGICLPEFDPEAFKLFLKLMILDTWSVDALKALELPANQLLHLLAICRKYEMATAVRSLTELVTEFLSPSNDTATLTFKVEKRRKKSLASTPTPTSSSSTTVATAATRVEKTDTNPVTSVPAGSLTVSLAQVFTVVDTPFVCDGKNSEISFNMNMKIALKGLGFVGPVDADSFYVVTVQIGKYNPGQSFLTYRTEKRILAEKSKTFYFIFDQPVALDSIPHDGWRNFYYALFSLKGPNTQSLQYEWGVTKRIYDGTKEFVIQLTAPQLVEIVYSPV